MSNVYLHSIMNLLYNFDQFVTLARFSKNLSLRSLIGREIRGQTLFIDPSVTRD
jgi:hypothetical protein